MLYIIIYILHQIFKINFIPNHIHLINLYNRMRIKNILLIYFISHDIIIANLYVK
jgi:hypothetical protein